MPSILERGILSHDRVEEDQLKYTPIYDEQIVANRQSRLVPDGRTLWSFANLYFQPRNAMLYRVAHEKNPEDIAIVAVRREIMDNPDIYFSTGNAAHSQSNILNRTEAAKDLMPIVKEAVAREWWSEADGSKRTMVAECLVPNVVGPDFVQSVYVSSYASAGKLRARLGTSDIAVIPQPGMFFEPTSRIELTQQLVLVKGDMFSLECTHSP